MSLTLQNIKNFPRWIKITKSYTDFAATDTTNSIDIYQPAVNEIIMECRLMPTEEFTGGLIATYTISVGQMSVNDVLSASSVFTIPSVPFAAAPVVSSSLSTPGTVVAQAISTVENLDQATKGSVDIWLLIATLP